MQLITRDELKQRLDRGDTLSLIEVLSADQYRQEHIPGAVNVPVTDQFEQNIVEAVPDQNRPVVVYCGNRQCPASTKAAEKMDALGYTDVYDYEDGKADWKQAGLPMENSD